MMRSIVILLTGVANTLFACTGATGGRIVCFGLDGHIGIESPQDHESCCDELRFHTRADAGLSSRGGCRCIDITIPHGQRTMGGRPTAPPKHLLNLPAGAVTESTSCFTWCVNTAIGEKEEQFDAPSAMSALRVIVLSFDLLTHPIPLHPS